MGDSTVRVGYVLFLVLAVNYGITSGIPRTESEIHTLLSKSSSTPVAVKIKHGKDVEGSANHPVQDQDIKRQNPSTGAVPDESKVEIIRTHHMHDIKKLPEMTKEEAHAIEENHNLTPDLIKNIKPIQKRQASADLFGIERINPSEKSTQLRKKQSVAFMKTMSTRPRRSIIVDSSDEEEIREVDEEEEIADEPSFSLDDSIETSESDELTDSSTETDSFPDISSDYSDESIASTDSEISSTEDSSDFLDSSDDFSDVSSSDISPETDVTDGDESILTLNNGNDESGRYEHAVMRRSQEPEVESSVATDISSEELGGGNLIHDEASEYALEESNDIDDTFEEPGHSNDDEIHTQEEDIKEDEIVSQDISEDMKQDENQNFVANIEEVSSEQQYEDGDEDKNEDSTKDQTENDSENQNEEHIKDETEHLDENNVSQDVFEDQVEDQNESESENQPYYPVAEEVDVNNEKQPEMEDVNGDDNLDQSQNQNGVESEDQNEDQEDFPPEGENDTSSRHERVKLQNQTEDQNEVPNESEELDGEEAEDQSKVQGEDQNEDVGKNDYEDFSDDQKEDNLRETFGEDQNREQYDGQNDGQNDDQMNGQETSERQDSIEKPNYPNVDNLLTNEGENSISSVTIIPDDVQPLGELDTDMVEPTGLPRFELSENQKSQNQNGVESEDQEDFPSEGENDTSSRHERVKRQNKSEDQNEVPNEGEELDGDEGADQSEVQGDDQNEDVGENDYEDSSDNQKEDDLRETFGEDQNREQYDGQNDDQMNGQETSERQDSVEKPNFSNVDNLLTEEEENSISSVTIIPGDVQPLGELDSGIVEPTGLPRFERSEKPLGNKSNESLEKQNERKSESKVVNDIEEQKNMLKNSTNVQLTPTNSHNLTVTKVSQSKTIPGKVGGGLKEKGNILVNTTQVIVNATPMQNDTESLEDDESPESKTDDLEKETTIENDKEGQPSSTKPAVSVNTIRKETENKPPAAEQVLENSEDAQLTQANSDNVPITKISESRIILQKETKKGSKNKGKILVNTTNVIVNAPPTHNDEASEGNETEALETTFDDEERQPSSTKPQITLNNAHKIPVNDIQPEDSEGSGQEDSKLLESEDTSQKTGKVKVSQISLNITKTVTIPDEGEEDDGEKAELDIDIKRLISNDSKTIGRGQNILGNGNILEENDNKETEDTNAKGPAEIEDKEEKELAKIGDNVEEEQEEAEDKMESTQTEDGKKTSKIEEDIEKVRADAEDEIGIESAKPDDSDVKDSDSSKIQNEPNKTKGIKDKELSKNKDEEEKNFSKIEKDIEEVVADADDEIGKGAAKTDNENVKNDDVSKKIEKVVNTTKVNVNNPTKLNEESTVGETIDTESTQAEEEVGIERSKSDDDVENKATGSAVNVVKVEKTTIKEQGSEPTKTEKEVGKERSKSEDDVENKATGNAINVVKVEKTTTKGQGSKPTKIENEVGKERSKSEDDIENKATGSAVNVVKVEKTTSKGQGSEPTKAEKDVGKERSKSEDDIENKATGNAVNVVKVEKTTIKGQGSEPTSIKEIPDAVEDISEEKPAKAEKEVEKGPSKSDDIENKATEGAVNVVKVEKTTIKGQGREPKEAEKELGKERSKNKDDIENKATGSAVNVVKVEKTTIKGQGSEPTSIKEIPDAVVDNNEEEPTKAEKKIGKGPSKSDDVKNKATEGAVNVVKVEKTTIKGKGSEPISTQKILAAAVQKSGKESAATEKKGGKHDKEVVKDKPTKTAAKDEDDGLSDSSDKEKSEEEGAEELTAAEEENAEEEDTPLTSMPHQTNHVKAEIELSEQLREYLKDMLESQKVEHQKGTWSSWSGWGTCSVTCGGGGLQSRQRMCVFAPCEGNNSERQECISETPCPAPVVIEVPPPVVGPAQWSAWSNWSACSVTCGLGKEIKRRQCESGQCVGIGTHSRQCIKKSCNPASRSESVQASPKHAAKLECVYNKNLPVKEIFWVNPKGHKILAHTKNKRYKMTTDFLYIHHPKDYDSGNYHCVVITEAGRAITSDINLNMNRCRKNVCLNDGICLANSNSPDQPEYVCLCQGKYGGRNCEKREDSVLVIVMAIILINVAVTQLLGLTLWYLRTRRPCCRSEAKQALPIGRSWFRRKKLAEEEEEKPLLDGDSPDDDTGDKGGPFDDDDEFFEQFNAEWKEDQLRRKSEPAHLRKDTPHPRTGRRYSLPSGKLSQSSRVKNLPQPSFLRDDQQKGSSNEGSEILIQKLDRDSLPSSESDGKRVSFSDINRQLPQEITSSREAFDVKTGSWVVVPVSSPQKPGSGDIYAVPHSKKAGRQQPVEEHVYVNMTNRPFSEDQVYVNMQDTNRNVTANSSNQYGSNRLESRAEPQNEQNIDWKGQWRGYIKEEAGMEESPYGRAVSEDLNTHTNRSVNVTPKRESQSPNHKSMTGIPSMVLEQSPLLKGLKPKVNMYHRNTPTNPRLSKPDPRAGENNPMHSPSASVSSPKGPLISWSPGRQMPGGSANMSPAELRDLANQLERQGYSQEAGVNMGTSRSPAARLFTEVEGQDENMNNANEDVLDLESVMKGGTEVGEEQGAASQVVQQEVQCSRSEGDITGHLDQWKVNRLRKSIESLDLTSINLDDSL